ncbi:MAG TPA: hypothetical protein PLC01_02495 [Methylotenera sp.]|nr:hypothetical protein [Methylotenera sp.]
MAFTTPLTITQEGYSETHAAAYVKAEIRLCTPQTTVVQLKVWESQAKRTAGAPPLRYDNDLRSFDTQLTLQADNPIDYAYKMLENSGLYPDATWNV